MRIRKKTCQSSLIPALLSVSLCFAAGCGGASSGAGNTSAAKLPAPGITRGTAEPQPTAQDKRLGAIGVQLQLDAGARRRLGTKGLPTASARVEVTISGEALASAVNITVYSDEFTNGKAQFVSTNLPVATLTVAAAVKDAAGTTMASGSQDVTIVAGQVVPVNLLLSTADATGTGSVSVQIDTRPADLSSPSASIPPSTAPSGNGTLTAIVSTESGAADRLDGSDHRPRGHERHARGHRLRPGARPEQGGLQ